MIYRYVDGMPVAEPRLYCSEHVPGLPVTGPCTTDVTYVIEGGKWDFCPYCGSEEDEHGRWNMAGRDKETYVGECGC